MGTRPKKSIAERLEDMQIAFHNTQNDPEIAEMLGAYGYTADELEKGYAIYQAALDAVNARVDAVGAQQQATVETERACMEAERAYQRLAKVARAIFLHDEPHLAALGLQGPMPRTTAEFLKSAYTLFDNALEVEGSKVALAQYGFDEARLQEQRQKIVAYDRSNQLQEAAKGNAQQTTLEQEEALLRMDEWYAIFRKVARVALEEKPQLLEKLGIPVRRRRRRAG